MSNTEKFRFWCPLDISKAKNDKGEEVMRLGGIASTMDKDADGEFLDPSGFDIADFKKSGVVNWHHQAKNSPATIIGEPHKAEVRKDGFYVETDLYASSELAQEVYALAQTLQKDSKTRRLGYSIEGSVIERDIANSKIVKQAKITGLAITHMPKNAQTFADIIKGHGHVADEDEEDKEKSLSTTSGSAVVPESVDGYKVKNVSEEARYDKIFDTFPGISIEKAEKFFNLLNKIEVAMIKGKEISDADLEKAMGALGLDNLDENPFLEKACKGDETNGGSTQKFAKGDDEDEDDDKKMSPDEVAAKVDKEQYGGDGEGNSSDDSDDEDEDMEKGKKYKAEDMDDEGADEYDSEDVDGKMMKMKKSGMKKGMDSDEIVKAIQDSSASNQESVRALATLVKAQMDNTEIIKGKLNRTRKELAETKDTLTKAVDTINQLGGQSTGRKSLTKGYVERKFDNGDTLEKGGNSNSGSAVLSQENHKKQICNILDAATFAKGYDEEFSKATTSFEAGAPLSSNVIARLKTEHGVNIQQ
jgi:hypothetical protein